MRHHQGGLQIGFGIWLSLCLVVLSIWIEASLCSSIGILLLLLLRVVSRLVVNVKLLVNVVLVPLLLDLSKLGHGWCRVDVVVISEPLLVALPGEVLEIFVLCLHCTY